MGLPHVTVTLGNLAGDKPAYEAEFLVDTGAIDCLAPAHALVEAGVRIEGNDIYELANGEVVEYPYPYGFARVTFMGPETLDPSRHNPHSAVTPLLRGVTAFSCLKELLAGF